MYLDTINFIYIPGVYVIMNNKKENTYKEILNKIKDLITCNNKFPLKVNTITIDFEHGIIYSVKNVFPNTQVIGRLFH